MFFEYLKLYNRIFLSKEKKTVNEITEQHILALLAELSQLGYTLSRQVIDHLTTLSKIDFDNFQSELISALVDITGSNLKYRRLFRNFPHEIPDDREYLLNRIIGCLDNMFFDMPDASWVVLSCGHGISNDLFKLEDFGGCPICQFPVEEIGAEEPDFSSVEKFPLKVLLLGDSDHVVYSIERLLSSRVALTSLQLDFIREGIHRRFPFIANEIPFNETRMFFAFHHYNETKVFPVELFKSATDVLRYAVYLSGGDVSLANKKDRFKSISRKMRKTLLSVADSVATLEDMVIHKKRWIRLGEILHAGDYPYLKNINTLLSTLRNDKVSGVTKESIIEAAFKAQNISALLDVISEYPGIFARKLDRIFRTFPNDVELILKNFKLVISDVKTPVLLRLKSLYEKSLPEYRLIYPKGSIAKLQLLEEHREELSDALKFKIVAILKDELKLRYKSMKLPNGKLDDSLKLYVLPYSQRSSSTSLLNLSRGSSYKFDISKKYLRFFLHWVQDKHADHRTDLDLSLMIYDKNWTTLGHISYTQLQNGYIKHSGDYQSAPYPNGASEFIDIDLEHVPYAVRYIAVSVYDFTGHGSSGLHECSTGIMQYDESGKILFDPKRLTDRTAIDLVGGKNLVCVLDMTEHTITTINVPVKEARFARVEISSDFISSMCSVYMNHNYPTLYDLLEAIVEDGEEFTYTLIGPQPCVVDNEDMKKKIEISDILSWMSI